MSTKDEKSRPQWEEGIQARQRNTTPADYPEGLRYVRADHLPKIVSQGRFWTGIVLIAVGVSVFRSTIPTGVAVVVGIAGVAAGLCLSITAMRLNDNR
jgi:hypothetical protein